MTDLRRVVDNPAAWAPGCQIAQTPDIELLDLSAPEYGSRLAAARQRMRPAD
ncbi:hypothetical protein [Streptomyces sp. NPDC005283]|uniref:hypothetical protein n=1 Tax=Streptomyces sp. NPDC005283 TaxID=3156871 RepID=UPI0034533B66